MGKMIQNEQTQGQFQRETVSEGDGIHERETKRKKEKVVHFANAKRENN